MPDAVSVRRPARIRAIELSRFAARLWEAYASPAPRIPTTVRPAYGVGSPAACAALDGAILSYSYEDVNLQFVKTRFKDMLKPDFDLLRGGALAFIM